MSSQHDKGSEKESPMSAYAVYGAVGIQLAAAVVAGLFFGNYIDKKLGTSPWLAVTGTLLGFIGGMVNLVRILGWFDRRRR